MKIAMRTTLLDFRSILTDAFGTAQHLFESMKGSSADYKSLCGAADISSRMAWVFCRLDVVCLMSVV